VRKKLTCYALFYLGVCIIYKSVHHGGWLGSFIWILNDDSYVVYVLGITDIKCLVNNIYETFTYVLLWSCPGFSGFCEMG